MIETATDRREIECAARQRKPGSIHNREILRSRQKSEFILQLGKYLDPDGAKMNILRKDSPKPSAENPQSRCQGFNALNFAIDGTR